MRNINDIIIEKWSGLVERFTPAESPKTSNFEKFEKTREIMITVHWGVLLALFITFAGLFMAIADVNDVTFLYMLLFVKHFMADGPMQRPFQYINKGTYGHLGGIIHALIHAGFTLFIVICWVGYKQPEHLTGTMMLTVFFIDLIVHYHCDWEKVQLTKKTGWAKMGVDNHEKPCLCVYSNNYFLALLADQLVHALTYIWIVHLLLA